MYRIGAVDDRPQRVVSADYSVVEVFLGHGEERGVGGVGFLRFFSLAMPKTGLMYREDCQHQKRNSHGEQQFLFFVQAIAKNP